jgi:hypothetical protein
MKNLFILVALVILLGSCGTHRSHKCRGNANWYGNRNLSTVNQIDSTIVEIKFITYKNI